MVEHDAFSSYRSFANQNRVQFHLLRTTPCPYILFGMFTLPLGATGKASEHLVMSPHILALKCDHVRGLQGLHSNLRGDPTSILPHAALVAVSSLSGLYQCIRATSPSPKVLPHCQSFCTQGTMTRAQPTRLSTLPANTSKLPSFVCLLVLLYCTLGWSMHGCTRLLAV